MANIGEFEREIEVIPLPAPNEAPVVEPAAPAEPVPAGR